MEKVLCLISVGNELNSCLQTFGDCCAVEKIGADLPKKEELYGCMEKSGIVFDEKKGRSILLLLILSAMGIFLLAGTAIRRGEIGRASCRERVSSAV